MQQVQSGQQPQTNMMQVPPQVITIKDCSYLKDELSWEILAMKKCHHEALECSDQEIRTAIDKAGQMHQRHYTMLLKHLQTNNTEQMKHVPQTQ